MTFVTAYEEAGVKYLLVGHRTHLAIFMQPQSSRTRRRRTAARSSPSATGRRPTSTPGCSRGSRRPARWPAARPRHDGVQRDSACVSAVPAGPGPGGELFSLAAPIRLGAALSITLAASAADPVHVSTASAQPRHPVVGRGRRRVPRGQPQAPRQARVTFTYAPGSIPRLVLSSPDRAHLPAAAPLADRDRPGLRGHRELDDDVHGQLRARLDAHLPRAVLQGLEGLGERPGRDDHDRRRRVPAGGAAEGHVSVVAFSYAPPQSLLAWLAVLVGLLAIVGSLVRRRFGLVAVGAAAARRLARRAEGGARDERLGRCRRVVERPSVGPAPRHRARREAPRALRARRRERADAEAPRRARSASRRGARGAARPAPGRCPGRSCRRSPAPSTR